MAPKATKSGQPKQDELPGKPGRAARWGGSQPPQPQAPPPDGAGAGVSCRSRRPRRSSRRPMEPGRRR